LVETFSELLRVMWSENYNFVSPMTFRDALVRFAPQFSGRDQQDSQEFLMFLLDGLHEDMNQHASQSRTVRKSPSSSVNDLEDELKFEKLPDWQASTMSWAKYLAKNTSVIVDLFQGQYRSRLTCLSCKQVNFCNCISNHLHRLIEILYVDFHNL
jgi:ubiquitin carboxyl-terminal hydrolase 8